MTFPFLAARRARHGGSSTRQVGRPAAQNQIVVETIVHAAGAAYIPNLPRGAWNPFGLKG
jgi:hypothetical protein